MLNLSSFPKYLTFFIALPIALCVPLSKTVASAAPANQNQATILQNGDFRTWANGAPVGWNLGEGAQYEPDTQMSYATSQSLKGVQVPGDAALPSVRICRPSSTSRPARVMTKLGTPNRLNSNP